MSLGRPSFSALSGRSLFFFFGLVYSLLEDSKRSHCGIMLCLLPFLSRHVIQATSGASTGQRNMDSN